MDATALPSVGTAIALFAAGLVLGALLGALVALLLSHRRRAMALREERDCLQAALDPLRQEFVAFERMLGETRVSDAARGEELRRQLSDDLRRVGDLVLSVGTDARGLRAALQGNVNLRGQWGEAVLEQLLRNTGLLPGVHYERQVSLPTAPGAPDAGKRPDVVVRLPDGPVVAIDSKTLFPDYARAVEAETPDERRRALKAHAQAFRATVRDLASRHYERRLGNSVEFVLMFVPVEGAYQAAVSEDPAALTDAMERNVLPVGPSGLVLMLTLIRRIWRRDEERRNATRILEAARSLAERSLALGRDLEGVGAALAKARAAYDDAFRRLYSDDPRAASIANSLRALRRLQGDGE